MKKLIYIILFAFILCNFGFAQSGWVRQNPLPQGNMLFNVKFVNDNTGYMVGDNVILKTTNGGQSVTFQNSPINGELNSVWFTDENNGYIAGGSIGSSSSYDGLILKTTNGGNTWNTMVSGIISLWGIYFFDVNTGFVSGGNGNVLKTTNAGQNWISCNTNTTISLWSITFINTSTGFVVGGTFNPNMKDNPGDGLILKTTNGGANWNSVLSAQPYTYFNIQFPNSNTGYICGVNGIILKSADGGNNWSILGSGTSSYLFGLYAADASTVTVSGGGMNGSSGTLLRTTNGGINWNCCLNPSDTSNSFLLSVNYSSTNTGYAVGVGGKMLKTVNGGTNWTSLSSSVTSNDINGIFFKNDVGYAIASHHMISNIIATTNGGNLWSLKNTFDSLDLHSIYFLDANTGFICGPQNSYPNCSGILMKTTNGGNSWITKLTNTMGSSFDALYFANYNTGYAFGWGNSGTGNYKTTDGGNTWNSFDIQYFYSSVTTASFINVNTGFVGGWGTNVGKTTNGGANWTIFQNVVSNDIRTIFAIDQNNVYCAGDTNRIYKSANGGSNWTTYIFNSYPNVKFYSMFFTSSNTGYAVGGQDNGGGFIFITTNAGNTWASQNINTSNWLNSVFFISANTGYVAGESGAIFKTTTGGSIWVGKISSEVPDKFLLYQNYPNPFNPMTNIKFTIPSNVKSQTSNIKLVVFDILGKEIATLVNEKLEVGTYEVSWDASQYPSGVYFYKLNTENFSETKKMILLK
jgi:photosystem II stability/assembly factor-like uncharacterized protein